MSYLYGIGGVLLFQVACTFAIMLASPTNGSFVGLGEMLIGVMGIPLTAILNLAIVVASRKNPGRSYLGRLILLALVLPVIQLGLLILALVLRL